jgi:hypothetical protein
MSLYASGLGLTAASAVSVVFDDPATITYLGPAPGQTDGVTQINFVVAPIDGQSVLSVNAGNSTDYAFVYVR